LIVTFAIGSRDRRCLPHWQSSPERVLSLHFKTLAWKRKIAVFQSGFSCPNPRFLVALQYSQQVPFFGLADIRRTGLK
jgi:hypothetical protein